MKLNQLSNLFLAALVASISFTSCGNKETPAPLTDAQMLVGTWEITNYTRDGKPIEDIEIIIGSTDEYTIDNDVIMCGQQNISIAYYSLSDRVVSISDDATTPPDTKYTITKLDEKNLVYEFKAQSDPDAPESTFVITFKKVPTNDMLQGFPFAGNWKASKAFKTSTGAEIPLSELNLKSIDIKLISSGYVNITSTDLKDDVNRMDFACKLRPNSMPTPVIELYTNPKRTDSFGDLTILEILDQGKKLKVSYNLLPDTTLELTR